MSGTDREADRAWVQGITMGRLYDLGGFKLTQGKDQNGVYLPFFDVHHGDGSGGVRVFFEVLLDAAESDAHAHGGPP